MKINVFGNQSSNGNSRPKPEPYCQRLHHRFVLLLLSLLCVIFVSTPSFAACNIEMGSIQVETGSGYSTVSSIWSNSGTLRVAKGDTVTFRALPNSGTSFSPNKPTWTGATATETEPGYSIATATFNTASTSATDYKVAKATSCNDVTVNVLVIEVEKLQYRIGGSGSFADVPSPLYVAKGTTVEFKAIPSPSGVSFPDQKPTWTGSSGTTGATGNGETKSVTFDTVSTSNTDYRTVSATCGNTTPPTANVVVVEVDKLQYRIGGTGSYADVPSPLYVAKGTSVEFKAVKAPSNASWPSGKPVWGGTSGASGTGETKSVAFNTVSTSNTNYKTVSAECGNTVTANVIVAEFDMDVDADNTTPGIISASYPDTSKGDRSEAEEAAEDSGDGALTYANTIVDPDNDGVPGYADGIDKFGNGGANACWKFERLLIDGPSPSIVPNARYVFTYSASDPDEMTFDGLDYHLPAGQLLRIWKKDGDQSRSPSSAHQSGDFIRSGQSYTAEQLGWTVGSPTICLFVEAVDETAVINSTPITLKLYWEGTGVPERMLSETIKIQPYILSRGNPDTDTGTHVEE